MKRTLKRIANYATVLFTAGLLTVQPIKAEERQPVTIDVSADLLNKNVFRGVTYSKSPILQPNLYLRYNNFSANVWSNVGIEDRKLTEVDYTLGYNRQIKNGINFSLGYTLYTFPNPFGNNTQEVYCRLGLENLLNPNLTVFADFKQGKGVYGELASGYEFERSIGISVILHYNYGYFRNGNGLSHGTISLSKPFEVKWIVVSPKLSVAKSLSKNFGNEVYGGLNLAF